MLRAIAALPGGKDPDFVDLVLRWGIDFNEWGARVVPGAAGAVAEREDDGLTEPTFWGVLLTGLPGVLREGFLPLGAFYAGLELSRARGGIVASALASVLIYVYERRRGRDGAARPALARRSSRSSRSSGWLAQHHRLPRPAGAARGGLGPRVPRSRSRSAGRSPARSPAPGTRSRRGCGRRAASSASSAIESLVWGAYFLGAQRPAARGPAARRASAASWWSRS